MSVFNGPSGLGSMGLKCGSHLLRRKAPGCERTLPARLQTLEVPLDEILSAIN